MATTHSLRRSEAGTAISASLLGTTKRTDGTVEATYNGHPLYYFAGDRKPGDTTGQNINQSARSGTS